MNTPLRRLATVVIAMFVVLMGGADLGPVLPGLRR